MTGHTTDRTLALLATAVCMALLTTASSLEAADARQALFSFDCGFRIFLPLFSINSCHFSVRAEV